MCDVDHAKVVCELNSHTEEHEISWQWVHCSQETHFEPPRKEFNRAQEFIRQANTKTEGGDNTPSDIIVVKLYHLHGRSQSQLYGVCPDPVLAPQFIDNEQAVINWLLSKEANIVPRYEWFGACEEAAIVAILAKLIRNKSWNKDTQGHNWTKEEDLLGQAPVLRSQFQEIAVEAKRMVERLYGILLLRKGSGQGRTPREWSINILRLPEVKKSILDRTLKPLGEIPGLEQLISDACNGDCCYRLDDEVATERVRQICRDQH